MKEREGRSSGPELLRIICMVLIICHHYSIHGGFSAAGIAVHRPEGIFVQMLQMFGRPACLIFALMSGYYLAERGRERHGRRIVPLLAEQLFYSLLALGAVWVFHLRPLTSDDMLDGFCPLIFDHWYITGYVMMYIFIPFLNPWLRAMEEKTYRRLLLAVMVVWSVIPTLTFYQWHFDERDLFSVMYLTGVYIRLHGRGRYPNWRNLAVALAAAAFMLASVVLISDAGRAQRSQGLIGAATYFYDYNSLPAVVWAVSTFLFFSRLRFSSRWVNYIAGSMIGVYLIHDDDLVRDLLWKGLSPNGAHLESAFIHAPVKILAVFAVCLAVDLLRRATVEKLFLKGFGKLCAVWDRKRSRAAR